jgi:hypothetical protein
MNLERKSTNYDGARKPVMSFPLLIAIVIAERRAQRSTEAWYWLVVIVLRAAATNLADLARHTFEWPYLRVIAGLTGLQMAAVLPVAPRLIRAGDGADGRPAANGYSGIAVARPAGKISAFARYGNNLVHLAQDVLRRHQAKVVLAA